jgi:hypothetical protein
MPIDSRIILAAAIVFATLIGAWMFRYEAGWTPLVHRNRLTGAICFAMDECWFSSEPNLTK